MSDWFKTPKGSDKEMEAAGVIGLGLGVLGGIGWLTGKLGNAVDGAPDTSVLDEIMSGIGTALTVGGLGVLGGSAIYGGWKLKQAMKEEPMTSFRLVPKASIKVNPERVAEMVKEFRQLHVPFYAKRSWLRWQIIRNLDEMYEFRIVCPAKKSAVIKARVGNAYPDCTLVEEESVYPEFFNPLDGEVTHLKLRDRRKERGLDSSLQNRMGDMLFLMQPGTIMELTFSPASIKSIRKTAKKVLKKLEESGGNPELEQAIKMRIAGQVTAFDCFIDVWGLNGIEAFTGEVSGKTEGVNKLNGRPYERYEHQRNPFTWEKFRPLARWQSSLLTHKEIAPLFMLPWEKHSIWDQVQFQIQKPPVTEKDFKGEYGIGYIDSDDLEQNGRIARLKVDTLTNHGLIAGASGGGKGSSLMMFFKTDFLPKWIENEPDSLGMTIGDPHTEDIHLILSHLLDLESQGVDVPWERVKVVSFGTLGAKYYPVSANLLHVDYHAESDVIDRVAGDTQEVILSAFDSSGLSQSVSFLKKAVQGLLYTQGRSSLLDIVKLFEYSNEAKELRESVIDGLTYKNDVIRDWWLKVHVEIQKEKKDKKVTAIDTRLAPLLDSKSMQRFFCRDGNYFDQIPKWIEDGCLVLVDFKGADDEMFRLCAAWLAKQYFTASQARGTGGRPHLLVFDEVQKFDASNIFFKILTENRKFGLGLLLMTQDIEALDKKLQAAAQTNAGFVVSVRQENGAKVMADLLGDPFGAGELRGLTKGLEACIRSFDGKARLKLEYPSYVWDGKQAERGSTEEHSAKFHAHRKLMELLDRDHASAEEADQEIRVFLGYEESEAKKSLKKLLLQGQQEAASTESTGGTGEVTNMEEAREKKGKGKQKKRRVSE